MEDLKVLKRLVFELNRTNSSNEKKVILSKYPQCKKILRYTYDSFKQYYVTSTNLKKMAHLRKGRRYDSLYSLLEALHNRDITGHDAIGAVNMFIDENKAYEEILYRIFDRNLKTRTDAKLINKVWPGTVPSFDVALAQKYDDYADRIDFQKEKWFASRKLDGVRVITIIDSKGNISFWSRKGKEFTTLAKVSEAFKGLGLTNAIFDGEMCIVDKKGDENFTSMIKLIRRKDFTVPNPRYKIFDYLDPNVFDRGGGGAKLSARNKTLNTIVPDNHPILDVVEQWPVKSKEHLTELQAEAADKGWEGLILRKDCPYEGKRTNNMLKVKKFVDAEYKVVDAVMGPIRFIDNGKEVEEEMLSAITIKHKGYDVSVGSGFSMDFRRAAYKDPSLIVGKIVTVCYFEETTNKQGTISLRFPTVKTIYDEERDV
jgi:DNA ligase-1